MGSFRRSLQVIGSGVWLLAFGVLLLTHWSGAGAATFRLARSGQNPLEEGPLRTNLIYDGSTADRVDAFLRKAPENSTIYFDPGTFETRGVWDNWLGDQLKGFRLKRGWTLIGAGTNSVRGTVFKLVDVPVDVSGYYNFNAVFSTGGIGLYSANRPANRRPSVNHVAVRDLQIDCNYPYLARAKGTPALHLAGIQMLGNRGLVISNVLVRNAVSKKLDPQGNFLECFQVYIYNKWAHDPPGDYYLDKVAITDYQGGYTSAICLNGNATGIVQNCSVDLLSDRAQRYAFNFAARINHFTIYNNTFLNATRGINNDTGPVCTDVTIVSNRIFRCGTGVLLANSQSNRVIANTISTDGTGSGIAVSYHPTLANVKSGGCVLRDNTIIGPGGEGITLCYFNGFDPDDLTLYWSSGNIVQGNIISPGLQSKIPPQSIAPNIIRPGNRRHGPEYPACNVGGLQGNLSGVGFPSDIGPGANCSYCDPKSEGTRYGYISRVHLSGTKIDMKSDAGDGSGYSDFTTGYDVGAGPGKRKRTYYVQWADLHRGRSYRIHVDAAALTNPRVATLAVYIDWDHDGRFDGARDLAATGVGKASLNASIVIPATAALGSTRMRVMLGERRVPGPCDRGGFWGEAEDYTISVLP